MKSNRMINASFLFLICLFASCVEASEWTCKRSSECPATQICRIGACVPGDNYLTDEASPPEEEHTDIPLTEPEMPTESACPSGRAPERGDLVINEVLANVPSGDAGDANQDGTRDAYDDEFVEIINRSADVLDVSGVTLRVGEHDKFTFNATCLASLEAAVIFGGGQPTVHPDYQVYLSRARLALGNSGGSVTLIDAGGMRLTAMSYGASGATSFTLSPEVEGAEYTAHDTLNPERLFSPGTCADGASFSQGCAAPPDAEE